MGPGRIHHQLTTDEQRAVLQAVVSSYFSDDGIGAIDRRIGRPVTTQGIVERMSDEENSEFDAFTRFRNSGKTLLEQAAWAELQEAQEAQEAGLGSGGDAAEYERQLAAGIEARRRHQEEQEK